MPGGSRRTNAGRTMARHTPQARSETGTQNTTRPRRECAKRPVGASRSRYSKSGDSVPITRGASGSAGATRESGSARAAWAGVTGMTSREGYEGRVAGSTDAAGASLVACRRNPARAMRRVQLRGGARWPHARRTRCTLSVRSRAPTKQMGPSHRSSAGSRRASAGCDRR